MNRLGASRDKSPLLMSFDCVGSMGSDALEKKTRAWVERLKRLKSTVSTHK